MPTRAKPILRHTFTKAAADSYDARRGSAASRGYDRRWRNAMTRFLAQNPWCQNCHKPSRVGDHIIPHKGDMRFFWSIRNWQALCPNCHARKTAWEKSKEGSNQNLYPRWMLFSETPVWLFSGAPAAGKTTLARKLCDIVIDLDDIRQGSTREDALAALPRRNQLIMEAITQPHDSSGGKTTPPIVGIIATAPTPHARAHWQAAIGCGIIVLETPLDVCLQRAGMNSDRGGAARKWWARYVPRRCESPHPLWPNCRVGGQILPQGRAVDLLHLAQKSCRKNHFLDATIEEPTSE